MSDVLTSTVASDEVSAILVNSIANEALVTFLYRDSDDVLSIRTVKPSKIARCHNGNTCLTGFDLDRQEPRCFALERVSGPVLGATHAIVTIV